MAEERRAQMGVESLRRLIDEARPDVGLGEGWDLPDPVRQAVDFHWFHVTPKKRLVLAVLSTKPTWYVGHFYQGRMRQCERVDCSLCAAQIGAQVRYVFAVVEVTTRIVGVLEVGKEVGLLIRDQAAGRGFLRGLVIELGKASGSRQSRTEVQGIEGIAPTWCMSIPEPDLGHILRRTWDRQAGE